MAAFQEGVAFLEMKRIASYCAGPRLFYGGGRPANIPSKKGLFNSGKDPPSVYKVITVVTPPGLFFQDPWSPMTRSSR